MKQTYPAGYRWERPIEYAKREHRQFPLSLRSPDTYLEETERNLVRNYRFIAK